ncbi:MAG: amino acid adenylation domain-containing protein [Actinobacteria bacterium]|nr:amino acid adenylation domain-containing protein [Actinomycetota bacterium]
MGDVRVRYGELNEASGKQATLLRTLGCRPGDRVCLFLSKSPVAVTSMVAALKAGCAYVPVDVESPASRAERIVRAVEPRAVVVDETAVGLLDEVAAAGALARSVVVVSAADHAFAVDHFETAAAASDWTALDEIGRPRRRSADDIAHILFTSGSTGAPKGVVITHASVMHFVEWATRYFGATSTDRFSGHPPLHFDLSTFDVWGAFCVGAELHLVPSECNRLPRLLAEFIRSSEVTQWFAVPSVFSLLAAFDTLQQDDFPSLKRVLWCGEVLPTPVLRYWMERLPQASFTNLYGPTEATIASSFYTVPELPATNDPVPIGVACGGEELLLLDEQLRPVAPGEVGEIYIGGVGLSPGYWRDEETTREAFVPDLRSGDSARLYKTGDLARLGEDGLVRFLGRRDSQIKHRGYRIELGEIETAVNGLDEVRECAVVALESDGFEGTAICCAYVSTSGSEMDSRRLREALRRTLPRYMLPTTWLALGQIPKNANGKIDRPQVRELLRPVRAAEARLPSRPMPAVSAPFASSRG